MNKSEILAVIKKVPFAFMATVEGNEPRVRGMQMYHVDEDGIIFYTGKWKDVCKQITKNPTVEICIFDEKACTQVRIRGKMESLEDNNLKKEILAKNQFLNYLGKTEAEVCNAMAVFRLKKGKATLWTMAGATAPSTYIDF